MVLSGPQVQVTVAALTFRLWRHVDVPCPADDVGRDIATCHARLSPDWLRVGTGIWHEEALTIWHFDSANILMADVKIILNDVIHVKEESNNLIGLVGR